MVLDLVSSFEGLMRSIFKQSNRLLRYSCSSLLAGDLDKYGLMDYMRIYMPQS